MDYIRVGDKVISISKINNTIDEILELRCKGYSQQEVARILNIDRTFISRLESIGEIRRGGNIAVVGFPIANKDELERELKKAGADFVFLLTEQERQKIVREQNGLDLVNWLLEIISKVRKYQHCIILASNIRSKLLATLLDGHVYIMDIGKSPLKEDVYVDVNSVLRIIEMIKN
ncbi:hypothetical protein SAMN05660865_01804 [Caloramator fervidus]|uniref:HTH cro/C1-type domain-containing protein n=1 Tax=Caloramator fervidus TaxID=29344 RepID=A0A1H5XLS6_9CLOT|nr:helix-turn-helix domain-containing protein [Caloramator fervidus]SEG12563.1 hypothetical protein SAMN05660865_01804 [Caloramator fervidus]